MTPLKIQEINRVIAEAMGLKLVPRIYGSMVVIEEGTTQADYYNSISDAMEAWIKIIVAPINGTLFQDGPEGWRFTIRYDELADILNNRIVASESAETPSAAVSLALYEKIKEK